MVRPSLRQGRFYKFVQRLESIPAGIYRYEGLRGRAQEFSVGEQRAVRFAIREIDRTLVVQVPYKSGRLYGVSESEFFRQLHAHLQRDIEEAVLA